MSIRRTPAPRRPPPRRGDGLPTWIIFLVGTAIVFGGFYVWQGAQNFLRTGGLGVQEATERAQLIETATEARLATRPATFVADTPIGGLPPTTTPIPDCQEFRVIVPNAVVRELPSTNAPVVTGLVLGTGVCVLGQDAGSEWYTVDGNPDTRRRELAYMHESVIEAVFPTETPTITLTPSITPSITPTLTTTPTETLEPTETIDPNASPTRRPTRTPTPTPPPTETLPPLQNA